MTTSPMLRDPPAASELAFASRTNPSSSIDARTFAMVDSLTFWG
ncbi:hypothetical protein [Microbacterium ureisolvens]|nr:hypothetical protein [Microbacterium ureisolvens]